MLPAKWSNVLDDVWWCGNALPIQFCEGRLEIERVPVDDSVNQQVQPGRPIELTLKSSVAQFPEAIEEQCACQRVLGLALVETSGGVSAHFRVLPPSRHENRAVDTTEIPQSQSKSALARECGQFGQQCRRSDLAGTDRRDKTENIIPVCFDPLNVDRFANERRQILRRCVTGKQVKFAILEPP